MFGGAATNRPPLGHAMPDMMDKDELVRFLDRRLKIRALTAFEQEEVCLPDYERDFALAAIELLSEQPVMASLAGLGVEAEPELVGARR